MADPFNLHRFVNAQSGGVFEQALAELRGGRKTSHWMWFIFPQHAALGRSPNAKYYGLSGIDEARAYLRHPVLGPRLAESCQAILPHLRAGKSAQDVVGDVDAMKLKSSMEIFAAAGAGDACFDELLGLLG